MDELRASNREHLSLLDALRRQDTAAAGEVARRHVETLHQTMFVGLLSTSADTGTATSSN
ncbi:FCD domain-containing protein [Streptomyces sp. NPDC051104]|uniref:FCD domain-containing protein n=1 Tax=Streptomyces sp. NPDC051104 TaxID=3155044 RepID=UPI003420167B